MLKRTAGTIVVIAGLSSCAWLSNEQSPVQQSQHSTALENQENSQSTIVSSTGKLNREEIRQSVEASDSPILYDENSRKLLAAIRRALMQSDQLSFRAKNVRIIIESPQTVLLVGGVSSMSERETVQEIAQRVIGERTLKTELIIQPGWF